MEKVFGVSLSEESENLDANHPGHISQQVARTDQKTKRAKGKGSQATRFELIPKGGNLRTQSKNIKEILNTNGMNNEIMVSKKDLNLKAILNTNIFKT